MATDREPAEKPDLEIVREEHIKAAKALSDLRIKEDKAGLERHRTLLVHYAAAILVGVVAIFCIGLVIWGSPALQPLAMNALTGVGGLAAGTLWGSRARR